ncbi:TetR family transcriptional regulator [Nocardia sp. alder85J]|uniref:TetR family transcriptional regulator n=1 Tax=Nocardia sp. alder85J TaxID=2862949 RepID=UPI001CD31748|nr:TetR family transcriptional regulator [Nocardia sp. alder85J]MCX4097974.1 TetR family transcriptional regulator [Nocardia sp. alder85J]
MTDDSRARILAISLELFAERGWHAVTVREIADHVGLTKTAVLYHFPSKNEIVTALVEPLLADSETVVAAARAVGDPRERAWAVVTGLLDVWLRHRTLLRIHMQDQSLAADERTFVRLRDFALAVQEAIAGPAADFTARVRAAQVYAVLSDPVVIFADQPAEPLRAAILDGAARLLGRSESVPPPVESGPLAAPPPPRPARRGRPGVMTAEMIEAARRMRDEGTASIDEIAARLGVSRATLYRHLTESR